jgi:uncharacterized protein (TIGR02598 family)
MRHSRLKKRARTQAGFSLVEIMLALAIIAIGLIAIIGLIPQGVQSGRGAVDNTLAATIAHDTFNGIRLQAQKAWPPSTLTVPPLPLTIQQDICYDAAGTDQVDCVTSADRYFHVHLVPQLPSPGLLTVAAIVTWSAKSTVPANTNFFFTQIANYQK